MKINHLIVKKNPGNKLHATPHFPAGSFAVRDHLRSNLGIICGRGSFAALYSSLGLPRFRKSFFNRVCSQ